MNVDLAAALDRVLADLPPLPVDCHNDMLAEAISTGNAAIRAIRTPRHLGAVGGFDEITLLIKSDLAGMPGDGSYVVNAMAEVDGVARLQRFQPSPNRQYAASNGHKAPPKPKAKKPPAPTPEQIQATLRPHAPGRRHQPRGRRLNPRLPVCLPDAR